MSDFFLNKYVVRHKNAFYARQEFLYLHLYKISLIFFNFTNEFQTNVEECLIKGYSSYRLFP